MGRLVYCLFGISLGLLVGCASGAFTYKYYALDADSYIGSLRGPEAKDDLNLDECRPTPSDKAPCMVLKTSEFLNLKFNHIDMQNRLKKCGG